MTPTSANGVEHLCWLGEVRALVDAVDQAVYDTVAGTPTPRLDRQLVGVSTAANYSRLWLVTAATVAYSRVHTGVHYPSDVVIGAAVGELCGRAVSRWATRRAGAPQHGGDHDDKRR